VTPSFQNILRKEQPILKKQQKSRKHPRKLNLLNMIGQKIISHLPRNQLKKKSKKMMMI
jgi:hypothetical protein